MQALSYFHARRHRLDPALLITEAVRNDWPRQSSLELARLATEITAGKQLRFTQRLNRDVVEQWAQTQ